MSFFRDIYATQVSKDTTVWLRYNEFMKKKNEVFGGNLKRLREERNLTQDELSKMTGVSPKTISRLEKGQTWPNGSTVDSLLKIFNVPVSAFFTDHTNEPGSIDPNIISSISWKIYNLLSLHGQVGTTSVLNSMDRMIQNGSFSMDAYYELLSAPDKKETKDDK